MEKENLELEEGLVLTEEKMKEVESKVAELKKKDPKLKKVFPIAVEGSEDDEKEMYIGYFKGSLTMVFSKYLSASQKDQAVAMRILAQDCFLEGDKELIDDDSLSFVRPYAGQLGRVIEVRNSKLVTIQTWEVKETTTYVKK